MADEIVKPDENATPQPVLPPRSGSGIIIFALLLMIVVLVVAWLMIGRHRDQLPPVHAVHQGSGAR